MKRGSTLVLAILLCCGVSHAALAADRDDDGDDDERAPVSAIVVTARNLDQARADIAASVGATTYTLSSEAVEDRPLGETASIGKLLLQAPGVTQGAGRVQIRAQGEVQYRINNVIVPEGLTDISEALSSRLVDKVDVITGALPAQYGLQSGGVVNITTKNGVYNQGGQVELYGGSHSDLEPAYEYVGHFGSTNVFSSGAYRVSSQGLPSPDGAATPLHDATHQLGGMVFIDHIVSDEARASLIVGGSDDRFQLPHPRGLNAATYADGAAFVRPLTVGAATGYPSEAWGGTDRESGVYALAAYQRSAGPLTVQASAFARYSVATLRPDPVGDLLFTGLARGSDNEDVTGGAQFEGAYHLGSANTVRAGVLAQWTTSANRETVAVLPVDAAGRQTSIVPLSVVDRVHEARQSFGGFVQDEWKITAHLTANPGVRFDHAEGPGGGDQWSPRFNLVWTDGQGLTLHGGYARYFVPAPELEVAVNPAPFAGTTGALPTGFSTSERAETDDYFDVGVQQKTGGLTLGVDAYWRSARNLIDRATLGQTALARPFNYDRGRVRGVEFSATYTQGRVSGWANLAASRAEGQGIVSNQSIFTAAELAYAAGHYVRTGQDQAWTASAGGSYKISGIILSAQLTYGSGLPRTLAGGAPDAGRMPARAQIDLSAGYVFREPNGWPVQVRADVVNLFDNRTQLTDGTSLGRGAPQFADARGVLVGIEQSF